MLLISTFPDPVERESRLLPSTHVRSGSKTSNGIENFLIRGVGWSKNSVKLCPSYG